MNIKRAGRYVLPLALLAFGEAQAELVTKEIVAQVYYVFDPGSALQGSVVSGDILSGTYTFETATPDQNSSAEVGYYPHDPVPSIGFDLATGDTRFVANPTDTSFEIELTNYTYEHRYRIHNWLMQSLPNGAYVDGIRVDLVDPSATAHENDLLQASAPDLGKYEHDAMLVFGTTPDRSEYYTISAHIVSINDMAPPAAAQTVTYNVAAQVAEVYDPEGLLGGAFALGSEVTGTYTVDIGVEDLDSGFPEFGTYPQPLAAGLGADLRVDGMVLRSPSEQSQVNVQIEDWPQGMGMDRYSIKAPLDYPLASGAVIQGADLLAADPDGAALDSDALTAEAPLAAGLVQRDIVFVGAAADGTGWFHVRAEITSIELDDGQPFRVTPPAAIYDRYQNFALGIIFDSGVQPDFVSGTLNGADITPYLNGTECQPGAPNDQQRITLVCPYFSGQLDTGPNDLTVTIDIDGRTFSEQVIYDVIGY